MAEHASFEHVLHVEKYMRAADVAELEAAGQCRESIRQAWRASSHCFTLRLGGEVAMVYGVVPASILTGSGVIWALGTDDVTRKAKSFLPESRRCLDDCLSAYNHLYNWVDTNNMASRRWLKWLGFEIQEVAPYGPLQSPFHRFDMRASNV